MKRGLMLLLVGVALLVAGGILWLGQTINFSRSSNNGEIFDAQYELQPNETKERTFPIKESDGSLSVSFYSEPRGLQGKVAVFGPESEISPTISATGPEIGGEYPVPTVGTYKVAFTNTSEESGTFTLFVFHSSQVGSAILLISGLGMLLTGIVIGPIGFWLTVKDSRKQRTATL